MGYKYFMDKAWLMLRHVLYICCRFDSVIQVLHGQGTVYATKCTLYMLHILQWGTSSSWTKRG